MPRGPRIQVAGVCYHVTHRGNNRERIFHCPMDYRLYLELLAKYKAKYKIKIFHYSLMPNHVHFCLQPTLDNTLSRFMHGVALTYTRKYNVTYDHVGHVWQGRFFSRTIESDAHLIQCGEYIEANPVRAKLAVNPADYPWSSACLHLRGGWDEIVDENPFASETVRGIPRC